MIYMLTLQFKELGVKSRCFIDEKLIGIFVPYAVFYFMY